MEALDYHFEYVARRVDDFVDVVPVVGVPFYKRAEGNGSAVVVAVGGASVEAIGLGVCLQWGVVCAALYDGLESEAVEVDACVFEFNGENMAELCWDYVTLTSRTTQTQEKNRKNGMR